MKSGGFLSDVMSNRTIHMDRSQSRCVSPQMDTLVLNGSSVNRGQSRVVCPGPVSVSQTVSYSHCPSERWVCREIKMPPPNPGSQSQNRSESGLGRSQTISVKSVSNQKPPIHDGVRRTASARVIVHHRPGASHETARASEQHFGNTPGSKPNCMEDEPLSPSLDATIENLNSLILELDPTFQPLNCCVSGAKKSYILSSNNRHLDRPSEDSPLDGHSPGILIYDEWDSGRTRNAEHNGSMSTNGRDQLDSPELRVHAGANITPYHQMPNIPRHNMPNAGQTDSTSIFLHGAPSSSISSIPQFLSSSPDSRNAEMFTCQPTQSSKGTMVQSPFQVQEHLYASPDSSISTSLQQGSQPMQVPTSSGYSASRANSLPTPPQQYGTLPIPTGIRREPASSCLSISPGSNNLLKSCHAHRTRLTDSAISLLSTSPGWDTLGSSHSLLSDDGEAGRIYGSAGSTYGSSGSFANLQSPYIVSPSSYKSSFSDQLLHQTSGHPEDYQTMPHSRGAANPTSHHPTSSSMGDRVVLVHHGKTTHQITEHPSSCPASAASSYSDIPLLLVNGSTQYMDQNSHRSKNKRLQSSSSSNLSLNACSSIGSSKASSTTSLEDLPCDAQPTVKFVKDTTKYWYKPNMSRDRAIEMLKDKEPGSFIIRESSTYIGSFGLAMKVPSSSLVNPEKKTGDSPIELVRHFLIEFSPKGVCLKGSPQEPFFGSLSALVYQHCITTMSLPCKLSLPKKECFSEESSPDSMDITGSPLRKRGAACKVLYLNSVTMESLTGPQAVLKAASITLEQQPLPEATIVQFKVSEQGVTITDSRRKLFFRRHYAASTVNHCGLDPLQRKWRKDNEPSRIFAFVAKNQGSSSENVCHLFAEYEQDQSAHLIINLVTKTVVEPQRV